MIDKIILTIVYSALPITELRASIPWAIKVWHLNPGLALKP